MNYSSAESEYLTVLLKSAIKTEKAPAPSSKLNWDRLISLSKSQQVYSVIASVLDVDLLNDNQRAELNSYIKTELVRTLAMKNELEALEAKLNEKNIRFMLLKGSVLRDYYPLQKMRQMSDIDILYDYKKREELINIMKTQGYHMTASCENSDDFFKKPFYTFEWHRELFFNEADFCPHFDLWSNALCDEQIPCKYHINANDHFVYTICHMYKHYSTKGCGIRFLCDIYLFMKNEKSLDIDVALKQLDEYGIKEFALDAISLSNAVFENEPISENQQKMFDFMMSNGVYGNLTVDYSKKIEESDGSKFKYILNRIFPSRKKMYADYRELEKKPYLLPLYYIKRLFTKFKYNSKSASNELKAIKNIDKKN